MFSIRKKVRVKVKVITVVETNARNNKCENHDD